MKERDGTTNCKWSRSPIERAVVALGLLVFAGGLFSVVFPQEALVVVTATTSPWGDTGSSAHMLTKTGARVYGVLAMLVGLGLVFIVNYPRRSP